MDALVEQLDAGLQHWQPDTSRHVRALVGEIIELADANALDVMRSRAVEQEVLNLLDEPAPR
jgi:hypothetical protein